MLSVRSSTQPSPPTSGRVVNCLTTKTCKTCVRPLSHPSLSKHTYFWSLSYFSLWLHSLVSYAGPDRHQIYRQTAAALVPTKVRNLSLQTDQSLVLRWRVPHCSWDVPAFVWWVPPLLSQESTHPFFEGWNEVLSLNASKWVHIHIGMEKQNLFRFWCDQYVWVYVTTLTRRISCSRRDPPF